MKVKLLLVSLLLLTTVGCANNQPDISDTENSPAVTEELPADPDVQVTEDDEYNVRGDLPVTLPGEQYDSGISIDGLELEDQYHMDPIRVEQPKDIGNSNNTDNEGGAGDVTLANPEISQYIMKVNDEYIWIGPLDERPEDLESWISTYIESNQNIGYTDPEYIPVDPATELSLTNEDIKTLKNIFTNGIYLNGIAMINNARDAEEFEEIRGYTLSKSIKNLKSKLERLEICDNIINTKQGCEDIKEDWNIAYETLKEYREGLNKVEESEDYLKNGPILGQEDMRILATLSGKISSLSI